MAESAGNNIPSGLTGGGNSGAGAQQQGNQGGGAVERSRIGDFGKFSANQGEFAGQAAEANRRMRPVMEREAVAPQTFEYGEDAQAQALAFPIDDDERAAPAGFEDDDPSGDVMDSGAASAEMRSRFKQWEEWDKSDNLGEPLLQKLVPVTVDGESYRVSVQEAANGYMMQSDYSDKLRQLYELKSQLDARERGMNNFLEALDKGDSFLRMIQYVGKFQGFAEAAIIYGTQLDAERNMSEEQRRVVGAERQARARADALEIELRQVRAQLAEKTQPQQTRGERYIEQQLISMVPQAIERLARQNMKWEPSPWAQSIWEKHWAQMMPALEGRELSTEHVMNVFMASIQDIRKQTRAGNILPPKQLASTQLPPVSGMSGAVQGAPNGGRPAKRARIGDIGSIGRMPVR